MGQGFEGRERPKVTVKDEDFEPAIVKFIHRDGYGFVTRDEAPDAYFHMERIDATLGQKLEQGMGVQVAVGQGKKGPVVLAMRLA